MSYRMDDLLMDVCQDLSWDQAREILKGLGLEENPRARDVTITVQVGDNPERIAWGIRRAR